MSEPLRELPPPLEPTELRAETRALVEEDPEEGLRAVNDARFLADPLWEEWGEELGGRGMDYEAFLGIARSYAGEMRLWVMGERIWEHCVAGLRGRVLRRLPEGNREEAPAAFAETGR